MRSKSRAEGIIPQLIGNNRSLPLSFQVVQNEPEQQTLPDVYNVYRLSAATLKIV